MLKASPDQYQLSVSEDAVDLIRVEAEINAEGNELYMSPYGPVPERWPKFIRNLVVRDMQGKQIPVQWVDSVKWTMEGVEQGQPLKIRYDVALKHEEQEWPGGIDGVAFNRPWGIMASGRALFVMNGTEKEDIRILFALPESWRVSTPWTVAENGYTVDTGRPANFSSAGDLGRVPGCELTSIVSLY